MATLPTLEEVEGEILRIFAKHQVRPGEMLMAGSFLASLDHGRFRISDLGPGLQSLSDKGMIEQKEGAHPNAVFLTETGFKVLPQVAQGPVHAVPAARTLRMDTGADLAGAPVIHVFGPNARVNIHSTDNSTNTVNLGQALLDQVIADLEGLPEQAGKEPAIEAAKELKAHEGKSTFGEKYRAFVATVSQTTSLFQAVSPYLSDLMDMLRQ